MIIKEVMFSTYDNLDRVIDIDNDLVNKHVSKIENKQNIYRLVLSNKPYSNDKYILNKDKNLLLVAIVGAGSIPLINVPSLSTLVVNDDKIFKRITWSDLGFKKSCGLKKSCGFKEQKNNKQIWYLRKLDINEDTRLVVESLIGAKI